MVNRIVKTMFVLIGIIIVAALGINALGLIGYRKDYYLRSYYGQKLLLREDLSARQKNYINFLINKRSHEGLMVRAIFEAPKILLKGFEQNTEGELGALWKDDMFHEFAKSDVSVWMKKNPLLTSILIVELIFLGLIAIVLSPMKRTMERT